MIAAEVFIEKAKARGFDFYSGVPCSYLKPFINYVINSSDLRYVAAANEGDAVAIAAGAGLGEKKGVVMFQNSGLGNAINPLTSLSYIFKIPILIIVTWRGEPGFKDEPQHELMGKITARLLENCQIPWEYFPSDSGQIAAVLDRALKHMSQHSLPYALIMKKNTVSPVELRGRLKPLTPIQKTKYENKFLPMAKAKHSRREALAEIVRLTKDKNTLIVASPGYTSRELYALKDRPNHLYMVGSMGCASSFGLGLALRYPDKKVIVIEGDGALLMRMGSLATLGFYNPKNLLHILLDNQAHESTGGQETVSSQTRFAAVAHACGYRKIYEGVSLAILKEALNSRSGQELGFVHLKIKSGIAGDLPRPTMTPLQVKNRLVKHLKI